MLVSRGQKVTPSLNLCFSMCLFEWEIITQQHLVAFPERLTLSSPRCMWHSNLWGWCCCCFQFTDEETKAHGGSQVTAPRPRLAARPLCSWSWWAAEGKEEVGGQGGRNCHSWRRKHLNRSEVKWRSDQSMRPCQGTWEVKDILILFIRRYYPFFILSWVHSGVSQRLRDVWSWNIWLQE